MAKTSTRPHTVRCLDAESLHTTWKGIYSRKTLCRNILSMFNVFIFIPVQTYPLKNRIFTDSEARNGTPPETFKPKVGKQNPNGVWNISPRQTSAASFIKFGWPLLPTSGPLSQSGTLKTYLFKKYFYSLYSHGNAFSFSFKHMIVKHYWSAHVNTGYINW